MLLILAAFDFLYCSINMPLVIVEFINQRWIFSRGACFANAIFKRVISSAALISVGLVALCRCLNVLWPDLFQDMRRSLLTLIVVGAILGYSIAIVMPTAGTVSHNLGAV